MQQITGDTIKLQFKPARRDFSEGVKNRLLFVVFGGLIPDFKVFSFPIEKAHWILSNGMEDPAVLTATREPSGGRVISLTKQTHKDSPLKDVNVDWTIKLNAKGEVETPKK